MRLRTGLTAVCLLAALAGTATADPKSPEELAAREARRAQKERTRNASAFAGGKVQIEGDDLTGNIERVTSELTWHDDLDEARQAAIEANKPILYIQALGDLSGLL